MGLPPESVHEAPAFFIRLGLRVTTELDDEPALAFRVSFCSSSRTIPGSTRANLRSGSIPRTRLNRFDMSMATATGRQYDPDGHLMPASHF
jgi:hypothetical protein